MILFIALRMAAVIGTTLPSASIAVVQRSRTHSAAPFTNRTLFGSSSDLPGDASRRASDLCVPSPRPDAGLQRTLMDLRSRSNSSVAIFAYPDAYESHAPVASPDPRREASIFACSLPSSTPIFSASTSSAASVGCPTALNAPFSRISLESLHREHTSATCSTAPSIEESPTTSPWSGSNDVPVMAKSRMSLALFPSTTSVTALI
mmetsp:Transcript_4339/g.12287  ORF Transcript_4339/g.12287 Transcript_4339/m.12287 type:complete len:205 (+) Transcript_4339:1552-2166(+)